MCNLLEFAHNKDGECAMYYINCFFLYSILGFLFEHLMYFLLGHKGDSGILYGSWTPVYGIGIIIIILVSNFIFKNLHSTKLLQTLVIFVTVVVLLTAIELLGGVLIEKIFKTTFWDYSNLKFHIGKYIALEVSFAWGLISLLVVYFVKPFFDKFLLKIPSWITILCIVLFIADISFTLFFKTKLKGYFFKVFK